MKTLQNYKELIVLIVTAGIFITFVGIMYMV